MSADKLREWVGKRKEIAGRATKVVGWYAHTSTADTAAPGYATVRGPFTRWFRCNEVPDRYKEHVASVGDDVIFCADSMNSAEKYAEIVEVLLSAVERSAICFDKNAILLINNEFAYSGASHSAQVCRDAISKAAAIVGDV